MGMLVDTCRRFQFGLFITLMRKLQTVIIWWVSPASLYFTVGWELRLRRIESALCFTIFGLVRLFFFTRRTPSLSEIFFGYNHCPPSRAEFITSTTWTVLLQTFSAFLWTPLSWLSRRLSTDSSLVLIRYLKLALLVPIQLMRALFYSFAAFFAGVIYISCSIGAPVCSAFVLPFSIFVSIYTLWLIFVHFISNETELPPWSRVMLSDTTALLRISFSPHHALQVVGRIFAYFGYFGCRDRWFRRDTLHAGIRDAVVATLPGLIGPIAVDQEDITDAVEAVRGLGNKWSDLEEKERLLDDKNTLVYSLSYKHIPVWEGEKMIRLSEQRAVDILRKVLDTAKGHGYRQVMMWCDGASVAGVRVDRSWVDIGLLPYTLYRTFRIESYVNGERLTDNRLWLELEKGLSELTCGMDVTKEYVNEGRVNWVTEEPVKGEWHKAMAAAVRVSARLTQRLYDGCAVSREEDSVEIRGWARKMLRRSGVREMNEGLGWSDEPGTDRRAKAVLIRITTLKPRMEEEDVRGEVAWVDGGTEFDNERFTAGCTQFWLGLLGFQEEEIAEMENEDMEYFTAEFWAEQTGKWEMVVVNLQGEYYVSMTALRSVELGRKTGKDGWFLLTNSQVEKQHKVEAWVENIAKEMFSVMGHSEVILEDVDHNFVEDRNRDSATSWFSDILGISGDWQHELAARRRERRAIVEPQWLKALKERWR